LSLPCSISPPTSPTRPQRLQTRHPFEYLANSIWRATGRPTRQDLDTAPSKRRTQAENRTERGPRGLPRRAFRSGIRVDLETLLEHWGGIVPVGMRDLWLHIDCCALTWTEPDADILELMLSRAMSATPGRTPRDVARMMRPTIRRGPRRRPGRLRACDPRYDYAGDRLCELLSVDRQLATRLDEIADPRSWLAAYVRNHAAGAPKATSDPRPGSGGSRDHSTSAPPSPAERVRPLATPEFLGISPGRARLIIETNRQMREEDERRFGHLRKRTK